MKNILAALSIALLCAILAVSSVLADATYLPEEGSPVSLCIPGVYLDMDTNCQVLGPAGYFTHIAYIESQIADQPDRFHHITESYGESKFNYFLINQESSNVYYSLDTAITKTSSGASLPIGYTFASYTSMLEIDGKKYFELGDGNWMRGSSVRTYATPNKFLGVQPLEQPTRMFGWILKDDTRTVSAPSYFASLTGNQIPRYTLIEVFEHQRVGLSDWYMIAPDEWIFMTQVALVYPAEQPPEGVENGRWIEINIHEQTLSVYEDNQLIFATLITSGSSRNFTRPGLFKIYEKVEATTMAGDQNKENGGYYLMDVPWSMYFDERRAIHAEYWHDHLGYKSSHGCVNMSFPDSDWLYQWADYDDWVYAWDPSGRTPEDPDLFTQHLED